MIPSFAWGDQLPRLQGRNVELRSLTAQDAQAVLEVFGDPEVMRYWSTPPLPDLAAATAHIAEIRAGFSDRRFFQWGICARDTRHLIGTCTLFNLELAHRRAEIGFAIRRSMWGRGLATDSLATVIAFAFGPLDLHRLEADADPGNERSLRVLERQGFRREGYLRERWQHLGAVQDGVFLGLLRREWPGTGVGRPATTLRDCHEQDRPFIWDLRQQALKEYVTATWGWDEAFQREMFDQRFTPVGHQVIVHDGVDVGLLQLVDHGTHLVVGKIELLPAFQRRGIGSSLIAGILDQARARDVPVRLQVLRANGPARRLYERLGFVVTGETETHFQMEAPCTAGR
jgi:[ribosomal protein S5]-alanine N-acetyltransferase